MAAGDLFSYVSEGVERFSIWQFIAVSSRTSPVPGLGWALEPFVADGLDGYWADVDRFIQCGEVEDPATGEIVQIRTWLRNGGDRQVVRDRAVEWIADF